MVAWSIGSCCCCASLLSNLSARKKPDGWGAMQYPQLGAGHAWRFLFM